MDFGEILCEKFLYRKRVCVETKNTLKMVSGRKRNFHRNFRRKKQGKKAEIWQEKFLRRAKSCIETLREKNICHIKNVGLSNPK